MAQLTFTVQRTAFVPFLGNLSDEIVLELAAQSSVVPEVAPALPEGWQVIPVKVSKMN